MAAEAVELRDEGGFTGLKLRLGRERVRDDVATIEAVRNAVGEDMALMVDFNQGLHPLERLKRRDQSAAPTSLGLSTGQIANAESLSVNPSAAASEVRNPSSINSAARLQTFVIRVRSTLPLGALKSARAP